MKKIEKMGLGEIEELGLRYKVVLKVLGGDYKYLENKRYGENKEREVIVRSGEGFERYYLKSLRKDIEWVVGKWIEDWKEKKVDEDCVWDLYFEIEKRLSIDEGVGVLIGGEDEGVIEDLMLRLWICDVMIRKIFGEMKEKIEDLGKDVGVMMSDWESESVEGWCLRLLSGCCNDNDYMYRWYWLSEFGDWLELYRENGGDWVEKKKDLIERGEVERLRK